MHTPGSATHHAAPEPARRSHDRVLDGLGTQPITDGSPEWTARRGGHPGGDRTSDVGSPLRFVVRLAVVAALVAVVLLVLRPSHPEWLAQLVHEVDELLQVLGGTVS